MARQSFNWTELNVSKSDLAEAHFTDAAITELNKYINSYGKQLVKNAILRGREHSPSTGYDVTPRHVSDARSGMLVEPVHDSKYWVATMLKAIGGVVTGVGGSAVFDDKHNLGLLLVVGMLAMAFGIYLDYLNSTR